MASTLGKIFFGVTVAAVTVGIGYAAVKSKEAADKLSDVYFNLPLVDRFIGMLYLTAELDGQTIPAEQISKLAATQNPAALLAMQLFSQTSRADRQAFLDEIFGLPYGPPKENAFNLADLRQVRAKLDRDKISYASDLAINVLRNDFPRLAVRLNLPATV